MSRKLQRISEETHRQLKALAARSVLIEKPETMEQILACLVEQEYQRVRRETKDAEITA